MGRPTSTPIAPITSARSTRASHHLGGHERAQARTAPALRDLRVHLGAHREQAVGGIGDPHRL